MATSESDEIENSVPYWVLRPLPPGARLSEASRLRISGLCQDLPAAFDDLALELYALATSREYDAAANLASAHVWTQRATFLEADSSAKLALLYFAARHLPAEAQARIFRQLIKDPEVAIRNRVIKMLEQSQVREVALPRWNQDDWSTDGWLEGVIEVRLARHPQGKRIQTQHGIPVLTQLKDVRKLLDIRSEKQLGYLLLASDLENGPYTKFTIPKRDGSNRQICAPKPALRAVQRRILDHILSQVAVHDAAHGFVPGRSTVANAEPHRGAEILLKFDLKDFFPTIHYYRVLGLFTSLGYYLADIKFGTEDSSKRIAPVLARLCCYTPNPFHWRRAVMPQGAPTSPTLSNLICRGLDARLHGLAEANDGIYTRYADDLTFSFRKKQLDLGRFRWWVDQICHQEGFLVNQRKFRVIRRSQRQCVTGIVVNDCLRIPREQRRLFRAIVHNCQRYGLDSQSRGRAGFRDYLRGYASYIHMVHPEEGKQLLDQVNALLASEGERHE